VIHAAAPEKTLAGVVKIRSRRIYGYMRNLLLFVFGTAAAWGQLVSVGVKAGVPVTKALPYDFTGQSLDTGRWTLGPTAEVHLPLRISVELDALYHDYNVHNSLSFNPVGLPTALLVFRNHSRLWDIPLLLKYRLTNEPIRPFVDAGFQLTRQSSDYTTACSGDPGSCATVTFLPSYGTSIDRAGPAAGAGLEFKLGRLRLAPEARYVRLNKPQTNQVTVLFGVTF
jgi:hypothetical protein